MIDWHELLRWLFFGGFLILLAYAIMRVGAFAYFRTKQEHDRFVARKKKGD